MVKKNKKGVWYFKVTVTDSYGNKKQVKRESAEWNRKDCKLEEAKFVQDSTVNSSMKLSKLADLYFEQRKTHIKESSMGTNKNKYENIIRPFFADMRIDQIDNRQIMEWHRILLERKYSNSTISITQGMFKAILQHGVRCNYLLRNPYTIQHVTNRDEKKPEVQILSVNDFNIFMQVVDSIEHIALYNILFWIGLRIGEAQALQISDIDFENNLISVTKTYYQTGHRLTAPKTSVSIRSVKMNKAVSESLHELINSYKDLADFNGERFLFGYIRPIPYTTFHWWHNHYIKLSGLPFFKIHSLRHSCVSVLISLGAKPIQIAKRMGHSVKMVNEIYGHLFPDDDQSLADSQDFIQNSTNIVRLKKIS